MLRLARPWSRQAIGRANRIMRVAVSMREGDPSCALCLFVEIGIAGRWVEFKDGEGGYI